MATKSARKGAETEINRLRTQVRDLQAQLARIDAEDDDDRDDRDEDRDNGRYMRTEKYRRAADEATDTAADLPVRMLDEVSKLTRGLTFAYLEQLRTAGEVLITFANEVMSRNRPSTSRSEGRSSRQEERRSTRPRREEREWEEEGRERSRGGRRRTISGLATDLPADVTSGFFRALNRSLDIPGRSVERFQSVYRETEEEAEPTLRERDRERERERRTQRGSSARFESRQTTRTPRYRTRRTTTQSPIAAEREETIEAEATA